MGLNMAAELKDNLEHRRKSTQDIRNGHCPYLRLKFDLIFKITKVKQVGT
jgi:hypothetical protein